MRYTPGGKPVTSFSVVTTHMRVSSSGTRHEEKDWFSVVVWGSLAEECKECLAKGQQVFVEGRIKTRRWQDANGGLHFCAEVVAQNVIPLRHDLPETEPAILPARAVAD